MGQYVSNGQFNFTDTPDPNAPDTSGLTPEQRAELEADGQRLGNGVPGDARHMSSEVDFNTGEVTITSVGRGVRSSNSDVPATQKFVIRDRTYQQPISLDDLPPSLLPRPPGPWIVLFFMANLRLITGKPVSAGRSTKWSRVKRYIPECGTPGAAMVSSQDNAARSEVLIAYLL